jgi:hypothetical protein
MAISKGFSTLRKFAAWAVIPAFISLVIAHEIIITKYPSAIGYSSAPRLPQWLLWWRNGGLLTVVLFSLISIPKWQSLLGLSGVIIYLYFALKF